MQPSRYSEPGRRLTIDRRQLPAWRRELAHDVSEGLRQRPKSLPPKYFYDERGSELFEQICETEEYYPTRSEVMLLERHAGELVEGVRPRCIVELGSGSARKVRTVLAALDAAGMACRYVPFDVSETMLKAAGYELAEDFPWLEVHGVAGDYERDLDAIPALSPALFMFLGGTLGNLSEGQALEFLSSVRSRLGPSDWLLLGTDLVKPSVVLDRAYNDAAGITAAFNKNVLRVINRELGATFDLDQFEHLAFFNEAASQVEMHLESKRTQTVSIARLEMDVTLARGERILTEVSRKFSRESVASTLEGAGLELVWWLPSADGYFALSLSRRCPF